MFRDTSPTFGASHFSSTNPPPSPPFSAHNDPLDDIYGSTPSSPILAIQNPSTTDGSHDRSHEILSDLPSRQRAYDTDAYREGLSNSKGQHVQEGFDEGYSLGANLGQLVGYILGVLQGFVAASRTHNERTWEEARELWDTARSELTIQELLGQKWVDEEGIWKWYVKGVENEFTFQEVAQQHPVIKTWVDKVGEISKKWNVDLQTVEIFHANEAVELEEQS